MEATTITKTATTTTKTALKERNDGRDFEHFALNWHLKYVGGNSGWLMEHAPKQDLFAAGFIHSYNQDRLNRIARRREID
jgi:hypothetical protein